MPFFTFTLDFSPFFLRFSSVFDFSQSYFHEFLILISTAFLLWNLLWEFTKFEEIGGKPKSVALTGDLLYNIPKELGVAKRRRWKEHQ